MNEQKQLTHSLKTAVQAFQEAGIEFVLIGGLAMIAHGSNHITRDVDLAYAIHPANLERLAAFLSTIHPRVLGRPANDDFLITPQILAAVRFLNLFTDLGQVDVMRNIPGVESFEHLQARAVPMDVGGCIVRVASLDDLIGMKRAANRPKDQLHLYELLALRQLLEP